MTTHDVTEQTFQEAVIERSKQVPVVVDFWAPWCGPCRTLGPTLEKLAREAKGAWVLAKVNVDENPRLSQAFRVQGIPAVKAVFQGKIVGEFTGALPESRVRAWLKEFLTQQEAADDDLADLQAMPAEEAIARYRVILGSEPENSRAMFGLGALLLRSGNDEGAAVLKEIPADDPLFARAQAALPLLAFAQASDQQGSNAAQRYSEASQLFRASNDSSALAALLAMVQRDRGYGDDAARKAMVALFALLGDDNPLVGEYRRKLANALF